MKKKKKKKVNKIPAKVLKKMIEFWLLELIKDGMKEAVKDDNFFLPT